MISLAAVLTGTLGGAKGGGRQEEGERKWGYSRLKRFPNKRGALGGVTVRRSFVYSDVLVRSY